MSGILTSCMYDSSRNDARVFDIDCISAVVINGAPVDNDIDADYTLLLLRLLVAIAIALATEAATVASKAEAAADSMSRGHPLRSVNCC
jgi:hypothetical protein